MEKPAQANKGNIVKTLIVYLGGAWVIIEALNFLIDKYHWNTTILDVLILLVIFGLPAVLIYTWFNQKFTRKAIILQIINGIIALTVIGFTMVNPGKLNPTQLRLLKFKDNQKQLAESIQSIAILPFDNFTGSDEFEYYVAGMHSGLIGDLGKISALSIISKTTSSLFKGADMSIPQIAAELDIDAVIEGTISCIGNDSVCIQLRLISAYPKEQQLWVQDYRVLKTQVLNFYNNVTKSISEEINIVISPQEESMLADSKTVDPEAYDAYLKARYYWDLLTAESLQRSLEYFNISLEIDPDFAPAYAGLATVWAGMMQMGFASPSVAIPQIYEKVQKAIDIDPNYPESHFTTAVMGVWTEWNWQKGEKEFLKALELNPNDVMSHAYYAHLLMILLRSDEAFEHMNTAMQLDPLNPLIQSLNGVVLIHKGDNESAIEMAMKALSIVPNHPLAWHALWLAYTAMGDSEKTFEASFHLFTFTDETKQKLIDIYEEKGFQSAVEEMALVLEERSQSSFVQPVMTGALYASIDQYEKAMDWLEKGYEMHDPDMPYIQCLPIYNQFKGRSRYDELVKKMNFNSIN